MLLCKVKIKQSKVLKKQKGLFADEDISKKSVVFIFPLIKRIKYISEKNFNKSWAKMNPSAKDLAIRSSGVRYVGSIFLYGLPGDDKKSIYLNHSNTPNLLYHCGICFAKKNIKKGDELTVDYGYFDTATSDDFINIETGKNVKKYSSEMALKKSTKELLSLLNSK